MKKINEINMIWNRDELDLIVTTAQKALITYQHLEDVESKLIYQLAFHVIDLAMPIQCKLSVDNLIDKVKSGQSIDQIRSDVINYQPVNCLKNIEVNLTIPAKNEDNP